MSNKNRRILRKRMINRDNKGNIAPTIFAVALVAFCVIQLIINAILSPLGAELQSLNTEKEYLLEENRSLEEDLASSNSLTVVEHITEKTLNFKDADQKRIIHVSDHTVRAQQ